MIFGTAGVRALVGEGEDRLNRHTINKLTEATYKTFGGERPYIVCYDTRRTSAKFAKEVCQVLNTHKVLPSVLFCRPTPELAFITRKMEGIGIMITASHNDADWNGFKVYDWTGSQIDPQFCAAIENNYGEEISTENTINFVDITKGADAQYKDFLFDVRTTAPKHQDKVKFGYSSLHGTGEEVLPVFLRSCGYNVITINSETPIEKGHLLNPEDKNAYEDLMKLNVDVIFTTDPDADRFGAMIKDEHGKFVFLDGNTLGAIFMYYLGMYGFRYIEDRYYVVTTPIANPIIDLLAKRLNFDLYKVPCGFKNIATEIKGIKKKHLSLAFEPTNGFLFKDYYLDKDGLQAAKMFCEICCEVKGTFGRDIISILREIERRYGKFKYETSNITEEEYRKLCSKLDKRQKEKIKVFDTETYYMNKDKTVTISFRKSGTEPTYRMYQNSFVPSKYEDRLQ